MVGAILVVIVTVIVIPVLLMMSGGIAAAVLGHTLKENAEATHEGSELIDLNT